MNEQNNAFESRTIPEPEKPMNHWANVAFVERFDARVRVRSSIAQLAESLGPNRVQLSHKDGEKPEVVSYEVDGEVLVFEDRIVIRYPEHPITGLGDCDTYLTYHQGNKNYLELCRTGGSAFHFSFNPAEPRQTVVFQTLIGALESVITLKETYNLCENGVGTIFVDYTMDFNNLYSQAISLRVDVRRLRDGEVRRDFHFTPAQLKQMETEMGKLDRFRIRPEKREKPSLADIRMILENGVSELERILADRESAFEEDAYEDEISEEEDEIEQTVESDAETEEEE